MQDTSTGIDNQLPEHKEPKYKDKTLDPLKHISKIDYKIDENEDLGHVSPFEDVEDSASYAGHLRKNAWRGSFV